MPTYHGSCHCKAVKYEVDAEITRVDRCNCSICAKKGGLFIRVPDAHLRVVAGRDALVLYQFNTGVAEHYFCRRCGIHPFGRPRSAPDLNLVNVRCLDDFDLDTASYEVVPFDGQNWESAFAERRKRG